LRRNASIPLKEHIEQRTKVHTINFAFPHFCGEFHKPAARHLQIAAIKMETMSVLNDQHAVTEVLNEKTFHPLTFIGE
jgi:hypothetical protein